MDPKCPPNQPPTTFVLEGFLGNHSRWEGLRSRIQAEIGPCRIWRYDNSGRTSLEKEGAALRDELEKSSTPINLVGYSMGGIVIREAARTLARPIHRAAFLHSPHRGTYLSYLSLLCYLVVFSSGQNSGREDRARTLRRTWSF